MGILLFFIASMVLVISVSNAATAEQNTTQLLIQTIQSQIETCMDQNAELVRRTCNGGDVDFSVPSKVAFHAGLIEDIRDLPYNSKLVYNKVYLNEGSAYNSTTGVFICPTDGIYVFHWIITTQAGQYFYADFMVNGHVVGRSHSNAATVNRASSSSVVQKLKEGDEVWIEPLASYNGQYAYAGWSFFSGYML